MQSYYKFKKDKQGKTYIQVKHIGHAIMGLSLINKGTCFSEEERKALCLDGLLPPEVTTLEQQARRIYRRYLSVRSDIGKYLFLRNIQESKEIAFHATLEQHLEEMMPIIYTPTVGKAVQEFSVNYEMPRGLIFSSGNIDRAENLIDNTRNDDVRMIVVTDSSAILGIGDQGVGGMAICIGKLSLYTSGGGVSPFTTMPISLDVGTNRQELLDDPNYLGVKHARLRGDAYYEFLDQFVEAVAKKWPNAIIQWEDFSKDAAFTLLDRYRDKIPSFNDDIQGTGAVVLAGLLTACKNRKETLKAQRVVVAGAGAGGAGVALQIIQGMQREGLTLEEAKSRVCVMGSRGLVMTEQQPPNSYRLQVSKSAEAIAEWTYNADAPTLMEVIDNFKPTILLGLTGVAGLFTRPIIEKMAENCQHPVICPLSNPTSSSEALPQDISDWTKGKAIIATGSPFPDTLCEGKSTPVGQGNNAFVFPGIGMAAVLGKCTRVSDEMILESAYALADYTFENHCGDEVNMYPPVSELQEVSKYVTARVLATALADGSSPRKDLKDVDLHKYVNEMFWKPHYKPYKLSQ